MPLDFVIAGLIILFRSAQMGPEKTIDEDSAFLVRGQGRSTRWGARTGVPSRSMLRERNRNKLKRGCLPPPISIVMNVSPVYRIRTRLKFRDKLTFVRESLRFINSPQIRRPGTSPQKLMKRLTSFLGFGHAKSVFLHQRLRRLVLVSRRCSPLFL